MKPAFRVVRDGAGAASIELRCEGEAVLRSPLTNKGAAFTAAERAALGLAGLLPPRVESLDEQVARAYAAFSRETTPLGRYRLLRRLQDTNEILFYAVLSAYAYETLPIVYTPTVGEAVERFSDIFEVPRGLSLSIEDPATVEQAVAAVPLDDVRMIVATDSSAILGIGDHGYNGVAIAIGKLSLYCLGGVSPFETLPVVLDVGTDKKTLHDDPSYLGIRRPRERGDAYLAFVRRFVDAVRARWPRAVVQWEDFGKDTAFDVLDAFRDEIPSFNDDIQGTGAVALAGLLTVGLAGQRFLVFGAGAGGIGVARAIRAGLEREGLTRAEASSRIFVVDSKGLLVEGRTMEPYKREFAQGPAITAEWRIAGATPTLLETIAYGGVTALLGLSGQRSSFDEEVVRALGRNTERPIVFALSNPTSACEAVPADVLAWTGGRAIVATGSPFDPVELDGKTYTIGQGNNAFVFPGLGFGANLARARKITDGMVSEAAYALAEYTALRYADRGLVYPPIEDLHEVSILVATRVARRAMLDGVAAEDLPEEEAALLARVRSLAWTPRYLPLRRI